MVDAEGLVADFLRPIVGVKVGTKVPNPRPSRFVRVWRSGGSAANRVLDVPHITVICWAESTVEASKLAASARHALLNDHVGMSLVRGVEEVGGPYYDPDADTGADRYTFTVALRIRAQRA